MSSVQSRQNSATLEERPVASPANAARTVRILVVDDEPLACQMFTDLLEARGFAVVTAMRGEEALSRLDDVDLVLLDAMLPGRDGWSICQEIKQRFDPLLPVIMVTARTAPEDVVRTFKAGADDYVGKPFHVAELIARIESRLRVHRAERALQDANRRLADMAHQNYELYDQARRDADERTHLLRELDHRVRNNLSVIMGLVSMERNRTPPRPAAAALESLESRLRSFLLVHEALRQQGYQGVPLRDVVERLAQRLRNTRPDGGRIRLEVTGTASLLDERQGFAVALALNELITNALRHAFPAGEQGTLTIDIDESDGEVRLTVADDGIGTQRPTERVLGSGHAIVEALVRRELGGRIEYPAAERGTRVLVAFPAE
jgi:DNA-binding response OmpR family regulator/anti-sigma regulatory factor (Ser/Thr protein kinase)